MSTKEMMKIGFNSSRWKKVKENSDLWWNGKLNRPLIHIVLEDDSKMSLESPLPFNSLIPSYGLETPIEDIAESWHHKLCSNTYMGDAFPSMYVDFGPAFLGSLVGGKIEVTEETTWLHPFKEKQISEYQLEFDPENVWRKRFFEFCQAASRHWGEDVQLGIASGGIYDVLAALLKPDRLLIDMHDNPDEVKRLAWQAHRLAWRFFNEAYSALGPVRPGYSSWPSIFSTTPYQMLVCDFSCMIGPEMFEEFIKPELIAYTKKLDRSFYHLDGPGALKHLKSLLEIEQLTGIQWIPGAGQPDIEEWPDVFQQIRSAGKLVQVFCFGIPGLERFNTLAKKLGNAVEGFVVIANGIDVSQKSEVESFLEKYGAL